MADVITLAAGAVPRLVSQLWDDLVVRRLALDDVPIRVDELTPDRLARLLDADGRGLRIGGLEVLDEHSGTTGRARLALHDASGAGAATLPPTIFAKLAPVDRATRVFVDLMGLAPNEVQFYGQIREAVAPHLDVPRMYAARMAGSGGRFVLLLEDLGADDQVVFGQARPLSPDEAVPVVQALARMQAALWQSPRFDGDLAWLKRPTSTTNRRVEKAVTSLATKPCLERYGASMPEAMQNAVRLVASERDRLEVLWGREAHAFSHGDPHLGNFYTRSGRPGFYDWQVCQIAQGTRDLTYFLVTSVDREQLPARERELVGRYRDALVEAGVQAKPLDELMEEVRLHVLMVLIAVTVTAAASTMQSEAVVRNAIENCKAALLRHDPLTAFHNAG
jgi:aminoglycoside phosphotransferase (APT) family kinase protein